MKIVARAPLRIDPAGGGTDAPPYSIEYGGCVVNFSIARYWVPEYGSSEDVAQFKTLLAYSPYHNVKDGVRYPPTLFTAGASDSRVDPLHARKMVAALQAASSCRDRNPVVLSQEGRAGHGVGKPVGKRADEFADGLTFIGGKLGLEP